MQNQTICQRIRARLYSALIIILELLSKLPFIPKHLWPTVLTIGIALAVTGGWCFWQTQSLTRFDNPKYHEEQNLLLDEYTRIMDLPQSTPTEKQKKSDKLGIFQQKNDRIERAHQKYREQQPTIIILSLGMVGMGAILMVFSISNWWRIQKEAELSFIRNETRISELHENSLPISFKIDRAIKETDHKAKQHTRHSIIRSIWHSLFGKPN